MQKLAFSYNEVRKALKDKHYSISTVDQGYKWNRTKLARYTVRSKITGIILYDNILMCNLIDRLQIEGVLPYQ